MRHTEPSLVPLADRLSNRGRSATEQLKPAENPLERAEAGEARLQQVESDESGEEEPERAHKRTECDGDENKSAGEAPDYGIVAHVDPPANRVRK